MTSLLTAFEENSARFTGRLAAAGEVQALQRLPRVPDWLPAVFLKYPLIGTHFSLSQEGDLSGLGVELRWMTPAHVVEEATEFEPGMSIPTEAFIPIGSCAEGSGDPYFLDLRNGSDDPAVVRIPHDHAGQGDYPLDKVERVSDSLSDFLRRSA